MRAALSRLLPAGLPLILVSGVSRAAESGGLPQLDVNTYASQLFWLAVFFVVIYVFMRTVGIPRVTAILEERKARIDSDLDEAQRIRRDAEEAMKGYQATLADAHGKARTLLAETHEKNAAALTAQTQAATKEFDRQVAGAIDRIEAARKNALAGLRDVTLGLAAEITTKVAGRAPAPESVARAVDAVANAEAA